MKPIRSFLFVPGHRESWIDKLPNYHADAVILDLEDSVPENLKADARKLVARKIPELSKKGERVYVRINRSPHIYDYEDIKAVVHPELEGLVLSKPYGPEDIHLASAMASEVETQKGMSLGHTLLVPTLETARSMQLAYEIALAQRVHAICGANAKNADSSRALGIRWSKEGTEALYLWSRTVMAARAAGKSPIGGIWQDVHDLVGLQKFAQFGRQLGFDGEMTLHPSNVAVINQAYSPSEEEVRYYEGMIAAYEAATSQGLGAAIYQGEHIDLAHIQTARATVAFAQDLKQDGYSSI
jgi:citrate lyase subunit beta / citryl-CoA lyase